MDYLYLLAVVIVTVDGNRPIILNDLVNEVSWSSAHDYEVHDQDADQEHQSDDDQRYFTVAVTAVAQDNVQDREGHQQLNHGKDKVSIESTANGESGLLDHSFGGADSDTFFNEEETLHHGDYKSTPAEKVVGTFDGDGVASSVDSSLTLNPPSSTITSEESKSYIDSEPEGDEDHEQHEGVQGGDVFVTEGGDEILSDGLSSEQDSTGSLKIPDNSHDSQIDIQQNTSPFENSEDEIMFPDDKSTEEEEKGNISTSSIISPEENEQDHSSTDIITKSSLLKVHLLKGSTDEKQPETASPLQSSSPVQGKDVNIPLKDSPITHINKIPPELKPPTLLKDVLSRPIKRPIFGPTKNTAPLKQKVEDSDVSSTGDNFSSSQHDDESKVDLQQSSQDHIINSQPIDLRVPSIENLPIYNPSLVEGIPVIPVPPYPGTYPVKQNQPVLHHIAHAILHAPNPYDDILPEDAILHRYSPHFVPYPAYLAIPYRNPLHILHPHPIEGLLLVSNPS